MRWNKSLLTIFAITIILSIAVYSVSIANFYLNNNIGQISYSPMLVNCSSDQTIMTIDKIENSHSGLWSANYPIKICYNQIYGVNYSGSNPHNCRSDINNIVMKISGEKNAHASISTSSNPTYNQNVCFGDLYCQKVTSGNCTGNYKLVASLSGNENAHVAIDDRYPIKICCVNNPTQEDVFPTLEIIKPEKYSLFSSWKKFAINQAISFEQKSYAIVDWKVIWNIGDGRVFNMSNCKTSNCNISASYQEQAHYTISAYAKESSGLLRSSLLDYTNILVYKEGINVFAIISSPLYNESISGGSKVKFSGKDSFVANCTLNQSQIPSGMINYSVGSSGYILYCYDLAKPSINGDYRLWFEWTFDKGKAYQSSINGTWNSNYFDVVEFNRTFVEEGQHYASLRVGYEDI